jgi:transcriptional regulator with XRE-family HTH domain
MERGTDKTRKPHHGRNVTRLREIKEMKQETLASLLGVTQQAVSKMEQSEIIDDERIEEISKILGFSAETIKNFSDEALLMHVETMNVSDYAMVNGYNNQCTFNSLDKYVEAVEKIEKLYEALLKSEREKIALLERLLDKK